MSQIRIPARQPALNGRRDHILRFYLWLRSRNGSARRFAAALAVNSARRAAGLAKIVSENEREIDLTQSGPADRSNAESVKRRIFWSFTYSCWSDSVFLGEAPRWAPYTGHQ